ncbi:MAG: FAD-dependent monooxygenase [Chitinophagales bacterium]|nr:FAD-dependent monooxygenase [Chitinophagales bacterium]
MKSATILGAGLVGSLLAIHLAKRGYKVEVHERRPDMRKENIPAGRSINLAMSDRGWRGLEKVGLREDIESIAIPMKGRMIHALDGTTSFQPYGKEGQAIYAVSRGVLNCALMNLAEQQDDVQLFFNERCVQVDLQKHMLHFENPRSDSYSEKSYDLLFGADGAFSALRHSMQFMDRYNYSQQYIEHGYKELMIPSDANGRHKMEVNALHIWPRGNFMLIALPNIDGTFTCTLFFSFEGDVSFQKLKTEGDVRKFFTEYFPDVIPLMPGYITDFFQNPTSSLLTVRCFPWQANGNTCLIGDSAHAIVPFFGQGMNCGFEDCSVLSELMDEHGDDWKTILPLFEALRKPNADAIADLALNNFIEMRDLVADPHFLHKKKIEKMIAEKYPEKYISPYQMVSFSHIPYSDALKNGAAINNVLDQLTQVEQLESKFESPEIQKMILPILFG